MRDALRMATQIAACADASDVQTRSRHAFDRAEQLPIVYTLSSSGRQIISLRPRRPAFVIVLGAPGSSSTVTPSIRTNNDASRRRGRSVGRSATATSNWGYGSPLSRAKRTRSARPPLESGEVALHRTPHQLYVGAVPLVRQMPSTEVVAAAS